jgi:hypothetical protein
VRPASGLRSLDAANPANGALKSVAMAQPRRPSARVLGVARRSLGSGKVPCGCGDACRKRANSNPARDMKIIPETPIQNTSQDLDGPVAYAFGSIIRTCAQQTDLLLTEKSRWRLLCASSRKR